MNFSIYDSHGLFFAKLSCPFVEDAQRTAQLVGAKGFVNGDYDSTTEWYDEVAGLVRQRLPMDIHWDGTRLGGVPKGATVSVQGEDHQADGTDIELSFSQPGHYEVTVSNPPFLTFETIIDYENSP